MAHSPFPWLERPALSDTGLPFLGGKASTEIYAPPDADSILSTLQQRIAAGTRDLDLILGEIAEAAHSLTGSTGAAIATRKGGVVICQGRSGDTAPALGTHLSVDSGFSGECLRTGKALRCDDTSKDYRADQEVCRQLGLRSIAAIPLRRRGKAVGILEAFSTQPNAFAEEHMDLLARLAQTAEVAIFESVSEVGAAPDSLKPADLASSEALIQLRGKIAALPEHGAQDVHRQRYRLAGVALAIIALISAVGWRMGHNSASGIASRQPQSTPATTTQPAATQPIIQLEDLGASFGAAPARKTSPALARSESRTASALRVVPRTHVWKESPRNVEDHFYTLAARAPSDDAQLMNLLSVPAALPEFSAPASQGVTGGVLVHKVQPIYPPQALRLRVEGSVLLQATITEDGAVRDLKMKRGHPLLVQAAIEAVSQWHYHPFLLNGKPVQSQVDVAVDFRMPPQGK